MAWERAARRKLQPDRFLADTMMWTCKRCLQRMQCCEPRQRMQTKELQQHQVYRSDFDVITPATPGYSLPVGVSLGSHHRRQAHYSHEMR